MFNENDQLLCDVRDCKKPAEYNIQNRWHLWRLDVKTQEYTEIKSWEDNVNDHFCEEHALEDGIIS